MANDLVAPTPDSFWHKVEIGAYSECWPWMRFRNAQGYGKITVRKKGTMRNQRAHRIAFELVYGPIPDGLVIMHSCDNPPCCNPLHLFAGTQQQNLQDMVSRGRHRPPRLTGESHPMAKLTEPQVKEIRSIYAAKQITQRDLARSYGVCQRTVNLIVNRKHWQHI